MKKETFFWQVITLVLGISVIVTLRTFLKDRITVDAMRVQAETMAKRGECVLLADEKDLNSNDCVDIDTTAYTLYNK